MLENGLLYHSYIVRIYRDYSDSCIFSNICRIILEPWGKGTVNYVHMFSMN